MQAHRPLIHAFTRTTNNEKRSISRHHMLRGKLGSGGRRGFGCALMRSPCLWEIEIRALWRSSGAACLFVGKPALFEATRLLFPGKIAPSVGRRTSFLFALMFVGPHTVLVDVPLLFPHKIGMTNDGFFAVFHSGFCQEVYALGEASGLLYPARALGRYECGEGDSLLGPSRP